MPVCASLIRSLGRKLAGAVTGIVVLSLLASCGGGDEASTPIPAVPTQPATAEAPQPSPTAEATPVGVSEAFPGLPLDKLTAMAYDADAHRMTLTTTLAPGATAEGEALCSAFIAVALFAPDASIDVLANDYSFLARCTTS